MLDKPFAFKDCSVWANNSRYYINGRSISLTSKMYSRHTPEHLLSELQKYRDENHYDAFNQFIERFIQANSTRFHEIVNEAHQFIQEQAAKFPTENIVLSFSGGKAIPFGVIVPAIVGAWGCGTWYEYVWEFKTCFDPDWPTYFVYPRAA